MSGTGSSNRPCLEFIGDGDAKLGLSPLGSGMGNTSGIPSTLSAATPIGAGHFGSVFTGASIGGVGSKGGSIWAVVRAAALFTGSLTPTSGGSTPGYGLSSTFGFLRDAYCRCNVGDGCFFCFPHKGRIGSIRCWVAHSA